jgi:hypothetical protein
MIDLRNGKKQLDRDMKTLADQKFDLETQIASYEFKHKSLEELLATLKDGQSNARVQKMIEWQQKLEKVKLNELRHIRLNKRLETDVSLIKKDASPHFSLYINWCVLGVSAFLFPILENENAFPIPGTWSSFNISRFKEWNSSMTSLTRALL